MPQTITPQHEDSPAPEMIPDRSDLATLYGRPIDTEALRQHVPDAQAKPKVQPYIPPVELNAFVASLTVFVPYAITFAASWQIFATRERPDGDVTAQLDMFALSPVAVVPWLVFLFVGRRIFDMYTVSLGLFMMLYAFFLAPATKILIDLQTSFESVLWLLGAGLVASWLYVIVMKQALVRYRETHKRSAFAWLAGFVLILIVIAALI